jgi:RNA polymerase sigma factor (sigma-70 family)
MTLPSTTGQTAESQQQAAQRLEEAFARHQNELLGLLYCLVGHTEDARDALQDAFVKCWRHLGELGKIENLRAWIFQVALNAGRDMRSTAWRRRRRPLEVGDDAWPQSDSQPEADASRREQLTLVRHALRQLRTEEQEVFLLRQNGGMTYEQIAEAVGIPVGTVKTRMRLAIGRLREAVGPKGDGDL